MVFPIPSVINHVIWVHVPQYLIELHCIVSHEEGGSDPVIWAQTCGSVSVPAQGEEPSALPYMEVSDIPYSSFEK